MKSVSNKSSTKTKMQGAKGMVDAGAGRDALDNIAELSKQLPVDVVQGVYDDVVLMMAIKAGLSGKLADKKKLTDKQRISDS